MKAAVVVNNLGHSYGNSMTLNQVSFTVNLTDFFIVIGPNGSGKTTLLKTICGLEKHRRGEVKIHDTPIENYSRKGLARILAYVQQTPLVDFPFTVTEVVLMGRSPHTGFLGFEQRKDREKAMEALEFTGIIHLSNRKMYQLSGGEQQRVFIARAICQEPQIMLLDEPTASLDLSHQIRIMDLMEKLKNEKGVTVMMVSHDVNLAAMYGDRLLLLKEGRIISEGSPEDVLTFETLEQAYDCKLLVDQSPLGELPRVTLVPRKFLTGKQSA